MSSSVELIPQGVTALVELFEERGDLRFPDLDAAVLQDAVAEVERVAAEVQRLEAELDRARELAAVRQDGLLVKAQRALAYARVFAVLIAGASVGMTIVAGIPSCWAAAATPWA